MHGEKVSEIAETLSLDLWWVQSVIVEYFNCRRYAKNGKLQTFDFGLITQDEVNQIPDKKVIIPDFYLVQNIRQYDYGTRMLLIMAGLPFMPMEDSEIIPEGLANRTCFPGQGNSIDVWDHKRGFNYTAVVRDDGAYYQWRISKKRDLEGESHHWFTSDICELDRLYEINREIDTLGGSPLLREPTPEFARQVSKAYEKLEAERSRIRLKILGHHNRKKVDFDPRDANVPDPPILSRFEAIKPTRNGYHVRTHMEPLFLRSAVRHKGLARRAREKRWIDADKPNHDALLDEIEHSAMCIISATNCLESYINYIIKKRLSNRESKRLCKKSLGAKWQNVPLMLGLSCRFDPKLPPFRDFTALIKLRNDAVHHKPEYVPAVQTTSEVVNRFGFDNAALSIKVVKEMVTALSSDGKVPLPQWITVPNASAPYWDEVSACLRNL